MQTNLTMLVVAISLRDELNGKTMTAQTMTSPITIYGFQDNYSGCFLALYSLLVQLGVPQVICVGNLFV